ncbi:hypothetical protein GUITHDRAFT_145819 [Guillardia theta CCMP2712]|uniref:Uncharacterized protein n=1 Tax=Guillardia theta (strain CCMP2712) TaxID=905079 RepID=L1IKB8_GUITC|nr:hypothetical protein GUITHDRAFT_145819 [Guillardia theta CCMP2712]EKX36354.1 hypothetical protein GUITHDRAFT_145819 [Guillardia theta CCMP2712]|eukprot:XP_005823334.1 hypothetical protein GUITHDRAFT_145819 [Guillardia theta CCMP2712]
MLPRLPLLFRSRSPCCASALLFSPAEDADGQLALDPESEKGSLGSSLSLSLDFLSSLLPPPPASCPSASCRSVMDALGGCPCEPWCSDRPASDDVVDLDGKLDVGLLEPSGEPSGPEPLEMDASLLSSGDSLPEDLSHLVLASEPEHSSCAELLPWLAWDLMSAMEGAAAPEDKLLLHPPWSSSRLRFLLSGCMGWWLNMVWWLCEFIAETRRRDRGGAREEERA